MANIKQYIATAPSNIALIKYWGKRDESKQWPANSSISMTLDSLSTQTKVRARPNADFHRIILNGEELSPEHKSAQKIYSHLEFLSREWPQHPFPLEVVTDNRFPTGCGIASSASGMAALTIASLGAWLDATTWSDFESHGFDRERLAHLARMGSGSAGRSLWGGFVLWESGENPLDQQLHPLIPADHWRLCDTVVVFSDQAKPMSSTQAHRLAWTSPLFEPRLAIVENRLKEVIKAIENRDIHGLGRLIEDDCLEMHGVIMSADPQVRYFGVETGRFLAWIRKIRRQENLPIYFTLDAGPNVHLIYEEQDHHRVMQLLETHAQIRPSQLLCDRIGKGPEFKVETIDS